MLQRLRDLLSPFRAGLERMVDHWLFYPGLALCCALDVFVFIVPTDGLVVSSTLLRPQRWKLIALVAAVGSALGVVGLAALVKWKGAQVIALFFADFLHSASWHSTEALIDQYGPGALALIALSPLPLQPAAILTALTHVSLLGILLAAFVGRGAKFLFFTWACTHAPRLLRGIRGANRTMKLLKMPAPIKSLVRPEPQASQSTPPLP